MVNIAARPRTAHDEIMRGWLIKVVIVLWAVPMVLFWGWYGLSVNDINLGTIFLSRELNTAIFRLYGDMLGVSPDSVPGMLASACAFDTAIVALIVACRLRASWVPGVAGFVSARLGVWHDPVGEDEPFTDVEDGQVRPAE